MKFKIVLLSQVIDASGWILLKKMVKKVRINILVFDLYLEDSFSRFPARHMTVRREARRNLKCVPNLKLAGG